MIMLPPRPSAGLDVYWKAGGCCALFAALTLVLNRFMIASIEERTFRLAVALSLIQTLGILSMAGYVFARRALSRFRQDIAEQITPALEDRVMAIAVNGQSWGSPVPGHGAARKVLQTCLTRALAGLKDSQRDHLSRFAINNGFADDWERHFLSALWEDRKLAILRLGLISKLRGISTVQAGLEDPVPAVRVEAVCALIASGDAAAATMVFNFALGESRLVRALVCNELKRHADHLTKNAVAIALSSDQDLTVRRCLEMLTLWKVALPSLPMAELLEHHQGPLTLPLLFALLPYTPIPVSIEETLHAALHSADPSVRYSACHAIGHLKLAALVSPLSEQLTNLDAELASASAAALANMGMPGIERLQAAVMGSHRHAAAAAMEALENFAVGKA